MKDIKWLLKEKGEIDEALKADDITPTVRLILQEELERFEKLIAQNREEWNKLFEPQEIDQLRARVKQLEASNAELLEACELLMGAIRGYFGWDGNKIEDEDDNLLYFIGEYRNAEYAIKKQKGEPNDQI